MSSYTLTSVANQLPLNCFWCNPYSLGSQITELGASLPSWRPDSLISWATALTLLNPVVHISTALVIVLLLAQSHWVSYVRPHSALPMDIELQSQHFTKHLPPRIDAKVEGNTMGQACAVDSLKLAVRE